MKMRQRGPAAAMYVIDAVHYLDDKGDVVSGPLPATQEQKSDRQWREQNE